MAEIGTQVVILTKKHRVEGMVSLLPGSRLTDFVNSASKFIAVKDAKVINDQGEEVFAGEFVDVHVRNIEIIHHLKK